VVFRVQLIRTAWGLPRRCPVISSYTHCSCPQFARSRYLCTSTQGWGVFLLTLLGRGSSSPTSFPTRHAARLRTKGLGGEETLTGRSEERARERKARSSHDEQRRRGARSSRHPSSLGHQTKRPLWPFAGPLERVLVCLKRPFGKGLSMSKMILRRVLQPRKGS